MTDGVSASTRKFRYNPTAAMIVAMVAGVVSGLIIGRDMAKIQFIGDIFFRLIQMGIVPFVMCEIIGAVGSLTKQELAGIGLKAAAAFLISSLLASAFGMMCALFFRPGVGLSDSTLIMGAATDFEATAVSVSEMITGFFPSNIISSIASGTMVPCIVFSVFFGVAVIFVKENNNGECRVYDWVKSLNEVLLTIIRLVMNIAPIGIFSYVSASVGALGMDVLVAIGRYVVVLAGATAVFTALWLIVIGVRCKMSIPRLIKKMMPMSIMAAATISSAVTLPIEMDDAKNKIGLRDNIANLVLPLGVPLNSNGSALHMAVTAVFVSQMYDMEFASSSLIMVCVIAWLLSLANAVAPGASLISLTMLIPALGLPLQAIAILGGLEYIVAAIRTTLNVSSDVFCALLVAKGEDGIDYNIFNDIK
ncbi:MAG: dicarboxylate/amino acid:cation symporter [Collinsella sp.]|nr:dicarboxylate/amino acid:cation symporter [Collinsella sp.]